MFLVNSRFYLFSAASSRRHPFSRSYGVILPSSLTRVLPFVLGFSPRLPVSVCGTGTMMLPSSFSCQREIPGFATFFRSASHTILSRRTSLPARLCACPGSTINRVRVSFCVPASFHRWYWNLNQLSIAYDFRPRLRPRLTLGGRTFPRKP